jgi:hypothetical protein
MIEPTTRSSVRSAARARRFPGVGKLRRRKKKKNGEYRRPTSAALRTVNDSPTVSASRGPSSNSARHDVGEASHLVVDVDGRLLRRTAVAQPAMRTPSLDHQSAQSRDALQWKAGCASGAAQVERHC